MRDVTGLASNFNPLLKIFEVFFPRHLNCSYPVQLFFCDPFLPENFSIGRFRLEIGNDVDFVLNKIAKKRKTTINKLINQILEGWVEDYDERQYGNNPKTEQKGKRIPDPDKASLDIVELGKLKEYVDAWVDKYGPKTVIISDGPSNVSYSISKD